MPARVTKRKPRKHWLASTPEKPLTIAFNPLFLQEGLQALGAAFAEMSFTTSTKPAVLSGRKRGKR